MCVQVGPEGVVEREQSRFDLPKPDTMGAHRHAHILRHFGVQDRHRFGLLADGALGAFAPIAAAQPSAKPAAQSFAAIAMLAVAATTCTSNRRRGH